MRFPTVCLFLACMGGCWTCQTLNSKIVGGRFSDLSRVPYTVKLRYGLRVLCGATIISPDWVVTAAHCIEEPKRKSVYKIVSGSNWRYFGMKHPISKIIVHKSFDSKTGDYDIALMKVSKPFKIGRPFVDAALLPEEGSTPKEGSVGRASGWGVFVRILGKGISSPYLREVDLPIIGQEKCAEIYKNYRDSKKVTVRNFCAGTMAAGDDPCQGDSGGPLVIEKVLVGVVSWGNGCGKRNFPGVYTDVGYFRKWIKEETGI